MDLYNDYKAVRKIGSKKEKIESLKRELEDKYGKDFRYTDISKDVWEDLKVNINELEDLMGKLISAEEYMDDVDISIYMMLSRATAEKKDLNVEIADFIDFLNANIDDKVGNQKENEGKGKGIRGRWNKQVLNYFPLKIEKNGATTWCIDYQKALLCHDNIDIFNFDNETNDITKYGFAKCKKIYDSLSNSSIENILFLDITLGISLTNCIFYYTRGIKETKTLAGLNTIIEYITQIPCIKIKRDVADSVFGYLKKKSFSKDAVNEMEKALKEIIPKIKKFYWIIFDIEWCDIIEYEKDRRLYIKTEKQKLIQWWQSFDNNTMVCEIMRKYKGIHNFEKYDEELSAIDMYENLREFCNGNIELDESYANMNLKEIIERLRKEDNKKLKEKVEIKVPMKRTDEIKTYALIHRNVMKFGLECFLKMSRGKKVSNLFPK